ncbi:Sec1 family protein [Gregarina niphandrodes]|uniref:Sec1 family protein n=1 Tax=Gregarina niphandrodes TaxID=110365 RepID=A0A023B1I2_GRENI|nr:Sec1 family protein [Gregarina niphandrodes]EZG46016.1 Sec1 family protein [Gregarina niphandrodes]|eukprot:XP_011132390.1 Sec1 family protein [Gregarina niphandrodes]
MIAGSVSPVTVSVPFDVEEATRSSLVSVLRSEGVWKVLILDERSQSVIAPLLKVGQLRQFGVTLVLSIDNTDRTPIPDTMAVYIVQPSEHNLDVLLRDISRRMYAKYNLQFIDRISDNTLQDLAQKASKIIPLPLFPAVVERFINFVPIDAFKFSLELPDTFKNIYDPKSKDVTIVQTIDHIVAGLICVLKTLGVRPIIKLPKNPSSPARTVGIKLCEQLKELHSTYGDRFISFAGNINYT